MWTISRALRRSTFSQAPAEDFSVDYYLGGEPPALSRSTPTAGRSSSPARTTERSNRSRFGTTFARSTDSIGEAAVMYCVGASRARTSVRSADAKAFAAKSHAFGARWPGSQEKSGPSGSSPRTRPSSSSSASTSSYRTLTRSGMMRNGSVSPRPSSAPPTSATGFGLLGGPGHPAPQQAWDTLRTLVESQAGKSTVWIPEKHFEWWPTPTHSDARNRGSPSQLLRNYIPLSCRIRIGPGTGTGVMPFNTTPPGRVNPQWLEWLMGQPRKWNSLEPLGTHNFLWWLHEHSLILQRASGRVCYNTGSKED